MMHSKSALSNLLSINPVKINLADDVIVEAAGCGHRERTMKTLRWPHNGVLTNIRFVPKLSRNLLLHAQFARVVDPITFNSLKCVADVKGSNLTIDKRIDKKFASARHDSNNQQ